MQRHPLCCIAFLISFCVLVISASAALAAGEEKKAPVPPKADLDKAEQLVKDIFQELIDKAASPESRSKLAGELLQQGDESGNLPAHRYVLYRAATDLAAKAG